MTLPLSILLLLTPGPTFEATLINAEPAARVASVRRVDLEVDHSALLEHQIPAAAQGSALFVREDSAKLLRGEFGIDVVDYDAAPAIIVKLAWKDYENSVYLIEVATRRPGEPPQIVETFEATCMNDTALTAVVLERLPLALRQLETVDDSPSEPSSEPAPADPRGAGLSDEPVASRTRKPLGKLGKAGTGLLATGAVGLIVGGVVLAQPRQLDNPSGRFLEPEGRNYRPPGIAVMVTGGVLAATGVVLLVVDRVRARKSQPDVARVWVTPTGPGMALNAKF